MKKNNTKVNASETVNEARFNETVKSLIANNLKVNVMPAMDCYFEFNLEGYHVRWGFMGDNWNEVVVFKEYYENGNPWDCDLENVMRFTRKELKEYEA